MVEAADTAQRIAAHAVAQLRRDLPLDVDLTATNGALVLSADVPGRAIVDLGWIFENSERSLSERTAHSVRHILEAVQDFLVRHTGEPWPLHGTELPLPRSWEDDDGVYGGFGDEEVNSTAFLVFTFAEFPELL